MSRFQCTFAALLGTSDRDIIRTAVGLYRERYSSIWMLREIGAAGVLSGPVNGQR